MENDRDSGAGLGHMFGIEDEEEEEGDDEKQREDEEMGEEDCGRVLGACEGHGGDI